MTTAPTSPARSSTSSAYDQLIGLVTEANLLGSTASILGWDQETLMPAGGLEHRARQMAQLARMSHELATDPRIAELLATCEGDRALNADSTSPEAVNIREIRRDYDRRTKLPASLVEEEARLSSIAKHEWQEARKNSDFAHFRPWLEKIVELLRKKAECFGWAAGGEPWDALAEDYEPGCTAKSVEKVFKPLRERLVNLLDDLRTRGKAPKAEFRQLAPTNRQQQDAFVRFLAQAIGFDFNRGRLDCSTHPFCSGSHCNDVRMTTRFEEKSVLEAIGSVMHESGHGIYEQGLPGEFIGLPMGQAVSLGIHESQSRMWENQVGRSRAFWTWCMPKVKEYFGDAALKYTVDDAYASANIVHPDFIRVEADEATYNQHIMVRFEIERDLLSGAMKVADLPAVWNAKYKDYLGITVPDDRRGCLQDIHWSMTSMGYFPTYTLGNLYCAQFFEKALLDMPDLYNQFAAGEFTQLKNWLNTNIHAHGMRYRADKLCEVVTGKPLSADPLLRHLESKLRPLYGL